MSSRPRAAVLATLAVAVVAPLWITAVPAVGHAVLVETDPADRDVLDTPPDRVVLRFNEPVELPPGGLRVFDAAARRIDLGLLDRTVPEEVAAELPGELPDGGYVVTWRVVSADSHPVAGAFAFTVGEGAAVDDALVAELFGGRSDTAVGVAGSLLRGVGYVGSLIAAGAVLFVLGLRPERGERELARRVGVPSAAVAGVATVLAVPVQAAAMTGERLLAAFSSGGGLMAALTSSFGQGSVVRLAGLAVLVVAWRRRAGAPWLVAGVLASLGSYLLDGHQRTAEPTWLLLAGDAVHVGAGAVWFGGLAVTAAVFRVRAAEDDPAGAALAVSRLSAIAVWALGAVSVAGAALAWALVRVPQALVETTYGRVLVAKMVVVGAALAIAAHNRWRLLPAVAAGSAPAGGSTGTTRQQEEAAQQRRSAWCRLRRTIAAELGILAAALMVTGFLVVQQPAAAELGLTGAFHTTASLTDELDLDLVVDPNQVGLNAIHLYVLDATGRPAADVDNARFELTFVDEDVGPFVVEPFVAGPGHWIANVDDLRFPGRWEVRIVVDVGRFEQASAVVPVTVGR